MIPRVYRIARDPRYQGLLVPSSVGSPLSHRVFDATPLESLPAPLLAELVAPELPAGDLWEVAGGALAVQSKSLAHQPEPEESVPSLLMHASTKRKRVPARRARTGRGGGSRAYEDIRSFFEMAGELIPLHVSGGEHTMINVLECINCLDRKQTRWRDDITMGPDAEIVDYVFHPNRFSVSSIFKIAETCEREVLVVERNAEPEDEFKALVEALRLTGVIFELLWENTRN